MSKPEEQKYPSFVSTSGQPVHIALISGHTAAVGTEPTPLHPRFHREAVIKGCVPEGFHRHDDARDANSVEATRAEVILKAIAKMVDEATADPAQQVNLFTGDGRPDANVLSSRCGFTVRAQERDAAWDRYANPDNED